jgi:alanyl-tRNA synthetase
MGDARCIEIWNLVFIQFNANEDGTFRPLPACHVDTGMGFERACAVIQGTKGLTDFSRLASNYDTDVFTPIFAKLSELTGKTYTSTVPEGGQRHSLSEQEQIDVAYRVIGDHIRTVSFAIADGIEPGNGGRNYVIRNILRRAVRFGRVLGFDAENPFLHQLVPILAAEFGGVFPELMARQEKITAVLKAEEEQFNRTLDRGLKLFDEASTKVNAGGLFPAATVVKLWETFGFPTDLTQLLLDERQLASDPAEVARLVEAHKSTGAEGQKTAVVEAVTIETDVKTAFVGFEQDETEATVTEWIENGSGTFAIVDRSPFYIEKGGQLGDTGILVANGENIPVLSVLGVGEATVLQIGKLPDKTTNTVTLKVETTRRRAIEAHHTATHLFHWALHQVVSPDATQQGSLVAPDRLRFDFNSAAVTQEQLAKIEAEVNQCIRANDPVSISEVPQSEVKGRSGIMQFFGDKYGDKVRVVQVGGKAGAFDGYSMELCGGTHVKTTGAIGYFKIKSEGAVAAGIRRVEAVCGEAAKAVIAEEAERLATEFADAVHKLAAANTKLKELGKSHVETDESDTLSALIAKDLASGDLAGANAHSKQFEAHRDAVRAAAVQAEKAVKKASAGAAAGIASQWYEETLASEGGRFWAGLLPGDSAELLQEAMNTVKARQFAGIVAMALVEEGTVHLGVIVHPDSAAQAKAGDLVREALAVAGGKGGGRPEMARGAAPGGEAEAEAILAKVRELLG